MKVNAQKMVPRYHYDNLPKEEKLKRRDEFLKKTGMSVITFYKKVREDSFKPLERELFNKLFAGN